MARNLNAIASFQLLSVAATLLHGSAAQTRHVVGGATGWTIPTGGASFYANWAANSSFAVGDSLVFNFANGQHNVAKVTKSAYDACNATNPITAVTSSPASVTLTQTGDHYFICGFPGHCSAGQKLAVNVRKGKASTPAASPSPQPGNGAATPKSSPVPAPSPQSSPATSPPSPTPGPAPAPGQAPGPAPGPASGPVTYTVGDSMGWTIPSNGPSYASWASSKSFKVGDILVFNYPKNAHNVEQVTKDNYDSCSSASPIATYTTPPARVTLNKSGEHYFICGIPGHCSAGQKLSIKVSGTNRAATSPAPATATSPSSSASSPSTNPSSPSPAGALTPPPENSTAAPLGLAPVSATILSVAAAAFFY